MEEHGKEGKRRSVEGMIKKSDRREVKCGRCQEPENENIEHKKEKKAGKKGGRVSIRCIGSALPGTGCCWTEMEIDATDLNLRRLQPPRARRLWAPQLARRAQRTTWSWIGRDGGGRGRQDEFDA